MSDRAAKFAMWTDLSRSLLAVLVVAALCLNGIWWGWTEFWNPDQMTFKPLLRDGSLPFSPPDFFKPPLLTYISFVFVVVPRELVTIVVEAWMARSVGDDLDWIGVWLAKGLNLIFACGCVHYFHRTIIRVADRHTATLTSLLLATSAGLIVQAHFITTDLPLMFMMVAAFFAAQRLLWTSGRRDYVIAGLMAGLACAMKYNGLAVVVALPVFHAYSNWHRGAKSVLLSPNMILGLMAVPLGFLLANPFALIEFDRFLADFLYLMQTSSDYLGGNTVDRGRMYALTAIPNELIGWPLAAVVGLTLPFSLVAVLQRRHVKANATALAALAVVVLYAGVFLSRTNVEVRWILPLVPFLLIGCVPVWASIGNAAPRLAYAVGLALVFYGLICSAAVGQRFATDPRMQAVSFLQSVDEKSETIESSPYSPHWKVQPGLRLLSVTMPEVSGRRRLFEEVFHDRPDVLARVHEMERDDISWFTTAALKQRDPDLVAVSSIYFRRFTEGRVGNLYPEIRSYFVDLLSERLGYKIIFDKSSSPASRLLYPKEILYLDNRFVILERLQ